jgi:hypothetical protein
MEDERNQFRSELLPTIKHQQLHAISDCEDRTSNHSSGQAPSEVKEKTPLSLEQPRAIKQAQKASLT